MKIRIGDTVIVISGKDKGKSGSVERVLATERRVIVSGINMRTRHMKKTTQQAGSKIRYEASIDVSKVMILDPKTSKPSRIGYTVKDGKKMRISKISGEEVKKVKPKAPAKTAKKTEGKADAKDASTKVTEAPAAGKKSPFWKRMKSGEGASQADVPEQSNMEKDHSIPSQEIHVRKGARGS